MKCEYCGREFERGLHTEHGEYCKHCFGPAPKRTWPDEFRVSHPQCRTQVIMVGGGGGGAGGGSAYYAFGGSGGSDG